MPRQLSLFDHDVRPARLAARGDPATAHVAGELIRPKMTGQIAESVEAVRRHPGRTSHELARITRLDRHMLAKRLPLAARPPYQLVRQGEPRHCAVTGRKAVTWHPTVPRDPT
jgi:hypothetical protein